MGRGDATNYNGRGARGLGGRGRETAHRRRRGGTRGADRGGPEIQRRAGGLVLPAPGAAYCLFVAGGAGRWLACGGRKAMAVRGPSDRSAGGAGAVARSGGWNALRILFAGWGDRVAARFRGRGGI